MRFTVSFIGLLVLPFVVGCEGNSPRRSPFAATSVPTSAKPVEYAPASKNVQPGNQTANNGPAPTVHVEREGNPGVPDPVNPPAGNPVVNAPIKIDRKKLQDRINELRSSSAIFLRSEVGDLVGTGIQENNNFVFRTAEGLNKLKIIQLMDAWRATKGKPPQTPKELLRMLENDGNNVDLGALGRDEFYIYDPELAAKESSKENIDYLQQYP